MWNWWRRRAAGAGEQNLQLNWLHAAVGAVAYQMIQPFIAIFAIRLGASNQELGSLSALPNLLSIPALLLGGWLLSRRPGKKGALVGTYLLARLLWLLVALVPWLPEGARVAGLILAWALGQAPHNAATTGMGSFLADLFPGEQRGRALAARHAAATGAGVVAGLVAGWWLDRLPYPSGYQLMFSAAVLLGLVEVAILWQMREGGDTGLVAARTGRRPADGRVPGWWQAWRYPPFLRYTIASVAFHFCWQLVWPLFSRYQVSVLGATNTWISVINLANALTGVLAARWWAGMAERYGSRRMLILAAALLGLLPGLTALAPDLYWLLPINLIGGVATSGVLLLVLNTLLEVAPAERRPVFLAVNQALVAVSATLAPLVGGWLMDWLPIRPALFVGTSLRLLVGVGAWMALDRVEGRQQEIQAGAGNL